MKNWDEYGELRQLIEKTPELSRLYRALGYSASLDRETEEIVQKLKTLVRIEIPDYSVFQEYVTRVRGEIEKCERGEFEIPEEISDPKRRKLWEDMAHPLFDVLGGSSREWKEKFWIAAVKANRNKSKLNDVVKLLETPYNDEWGGYMVTAKDQIPLDDDSFVMLKITDLAQFGELLDKLHRALTFRGFFAAELVDMLQESPTDSDSLVEANWPEKAMEPVKRY